MDSLALTLTLSMPVRSPSGRFALRYRQDGSAAILDEESGDARWVAGRVSSPAVGPLLFGRDGDLRVQHGEEVRWQSGPLAPGAVELVVTDEGDGTFLDIHGRPLAGLLSGTIHTVSLGSSAPVARITRTHYLRSATGRDVVVRLDDGSLKVSRSYDPIGSSSLTYPAAHVSWLEQEGTELTWRFVERPDGWTGWSLCLVDEDGNLRWDDAPKRAGDPSPPEAQAPEAPAESTQPGSWAEALSLDEAYRVIAIRDVDPDEALRRLGAEDDQISTSTWPELLRRVSFEDVSPLGAQVAAAFALGRHTLLVQPDGWLPLVAQRLAPDALAVHSSRTVNADTSFEVFGNGRLLASLDENMASSAEGAEPDIVLAALAAMGIDDPAAFDDDEDNDLDDLELLCQVAGIRPTVQDVTAAARVAVFPVAWDRIGRR